MDEVLSQLAGPRLPGRDLRGRPFLPSDGLVPLGLFVHHHKRRQYGNFTGGSDAQPDGYDDGDIGTLLSGNWSGEQS